MMNTVNQAKMFTNFYNEMNLFLITYFLETNLNTKAQ